MKAVAPLSALLVCLSAWSQQVAPDVDAEYARLTAERSRVESDFKVQEKACYARFAVNDCLETARTKRRQALAQLRKQELALNEAERKRKAAERQQALQEQAAEARTRNPAAAAERVQDRQDRERRAADEAAERAAQAASAPARSAQREQEIQQRLAEKAAEQQRREAEAAANVRERQARKAEARERREKLDQRRAERTGPRASPLPVPP